MPHLRASLPAPCARRLVLAAFFLSGAASLLFEVAWTRLLSLLLGASSFALGAVLAAFMVGMALGSALAARRFLASRDPILTYALLEGWAGLYGLASPYLLHLVEEAPASFHFGLGLASLLPATAAMGASLPVLVRAFSQGRGSPGAEVGRLYAANTAGAVAGPLLAVFWFFPSLGLSRTVDLAAGADLLVFLGLAIGRRWLPELSRAESCPANAEGPRPGAALLLALGASGASAMLYELAWARTLSLVYGSSVYAVSIMLSTFLLGLAGGAGIASLVLRGRRERVPITGPAWLLAGSAAAAFASLLIARSLPFLFLNFYLSLPERDLALFATQFLIASLLMLPSTLLLGALLPVATASLARPEADRGRAVAWLYTANLAGASAGALLASGVMLGQFGLELSVRIAALLGLAVALWLFMTSPIGRSRLRGATASAGAFLFILGFDPSWQPLAKSFGLYSEPRSYTGYDASKLRELVASYQLLYYRDGPTATVSVQKVDRYLLLKINGKTDASNGPGDLETQLLLGHLPLMASGARRVAVIGWGSGMTAGAVLSHPVEAVDAFEIEPAVVEASRFFEPQNGKPLEDSRLQLILGDARTELRRQEPYDLLISEPSNPWLTGVANLFTLDFFRLVASRLAAEGIFCQWFHLYGMSEESVRSLVATLRSVFPSTLVFKDRDLILLGSRRSIRFDLLRLKRLFEKPEIRANLSRAFVRYPFDLLAGLRLDEKGSEAFSRGAPLNTDDNMLLELAAPRSLYRDRAAAIREEIARYPPLLRSHLSGYASESEIELELAASHFTAGRKEEALRACRRALELRASFEGQKLLGQILEALGRREEARTALRKALSLGGEPEARKFVEALLRSMDSTPKSPQ